MADTPLGLTGSSFKALQSWLRRIMTPSALAVSVVALSLSLVSGTATAETEADLVNAQVPAGTKLVVADQFETLRTLFETTGEQSRLSADVTYAEFSGGSHIVEAFRAKAVDVAMAGNAVVLQANATGEKLIIVAALRKLGGENRLAVRPGLKIDRLEDLRGKKISYLVGTGRQTFILNALKAAGLTPQDVEFVNLRSTEAPDAIASGQIDVAVLPPLQFKQYLTNVPGAGSLPQSELDRAPQNLTYIAASQAALSDPAKTAAVSEFVKGWVKAYQWVQANPDAWVDAYYVKKQHLSPENGLETLKSEGDLSFPLLEEAVANQQGVIDLIHGVGDIPERLDSREQFDLRFEPVIASVRNK